VTLEQLCILALLITLPCLGWIAAVLEKNDE
jgi:hypothetical protein